jgi:hypothetical protein
VSATALLVHAQAWLAESPSPTPTSGSGVVVNEDTATPGLWGLFFFLALAVAVFFLWRSMNRQLSRISVDDDAVPGADVPPTAAPAPDPSAVADQPGEARDPAP